MTIVIKHGNEYNEIECKKCNAIIGFTKADIKRRCRAFEYGGEIHGTHAEWIICPECKEENYLVYKVDGEDTLDK